MKKHCKLISLFMAMGLICGATTGCGGKKGGNSDSEQTLDIYLLVHGYGKKWLDSAVERFQQEDWVKEKYPQLQVNTDGYDSVDATVHQKLQAGESINKFDLMFSVNVQSYGDKGLAADLTDALYNSEVPGEPGVRVIDKVPQRVLEKIRNEKDDKYYVTSYVQGMYGMLYNADLLKQMNLDVPLTTDQFLSVAADIKRVGYTAGNKTHKIAITHRANDDYWRRAFDIWWAQYEGMQGYENYFRGYDPIDEKVGSISVLDQPGRRESLEVIEDILTTYNNGTAYGDFKATQTAFLMGEGVFHFNGDYFASEMQTEINALKAGGINYDIKFMKMPVISAIIKECSTITTDAQLQAVIKEIDANKSYDESSSKASGISEEDYGKIVEARGICAYSAANNQAAIVPSYAKGKNVAIDFLRFMYTDESIRDFTVSSGGILFPSTYDILGDEDVMNQVQPIQKSMMDMYKGASNCKFKYFPGENGTLLGKGGLTSLKFDGIFEVYFAQGKAENTAVNILANEKKQLAGSAWDQMVAAAGLSK